MYSDAIANNEVTFNDNVFTKIADVIRRLFADLGYSNIDFSDARGAYNFLKDYNRSIHKGALSSGLKTATKGKAVFDTMDKKSVSEINPIQKIENKNKVNK